MKSIVHSLTTTVLLISTAIAHSQVWLQNWYFSGDAGAVFQQVANLRQSTVPPRIATFDPGVRSDVEVGLKYQLTSNASIGIAYKFLCTLDQRYYIRSINDHITISGIYIHGIFVNFTLKF